MNLQRNVGSPDQLTPAPSTSRPHPSPPSPSSAYNSWSHEPCSTCSGPREGDQSSPPTTTTSTTLLKQAEEEEEEEEEEGSGAEEESLWTTEEEEEEEEEEEGGRGVSGRRLKGYKSSLSLLLQRAVLGLEGGEGLGRGRDRVLRTFQRHLDRALLTMFIFMAKYHRELCILFLLFASGGLASLRSSPMKTRSTPTPTPFFVEGISGGLLDDYYRGEYVNLVQTKIPQRPSFVFYYAPWDAESVAAREVFRNVAQYFHKAVPGQLRFYAVNCWWPQGECRKNYKNLSHFPIFVAHLEKSAGIIYSGPIRGELMIKFLNSLLKPITRIDTEEEMWRFRAKHDAIMLGYFNFTDIESTQDYETYLQMALRNFEADPFGQVGFGVFLKYELAQKFFLTSSNVISLVLFNEIHTAKWTGDRNTQGVRGPVGQVANWVVERTKKCPITWAYQVRSGFANRPVALGPIDLVDEIRKGPVILLISRRYFPSSYSPFYAQVKEVALDYFNCNKSGNVTKLRRTQHQLSSEWLSLWNSVSSVCGSGQSAVTDTCGILQEELGHWESKKGALKRESLANYEKVAAEMNFTGFSCVSEREFKFLAIDPIDVPHFPQLVLGGLGFKNNTDPILFLIDAKNDMILPVTSFNISTLAQLIYNYTTEIEGGNPHVPNGFASSSRRFWVGSRSAASTFGQTSPLPSTALKTDRLNDLEDQYRRINEPQTAVIRSMTSDDLVSYLVEDEPNSLLLMFTAKFCGMCGVSLTHFIQLAEFMHHNYNMDEYKLSFAKLDMFKNSLPVELSPDQLPTFVYFPANNRSNSRVFGAHKGLSTKTLLEFVLSEMNSESRVQLSLSSPGCKSRGSGFGNNRTLKATTNTNPSEDLDSGRGNCVKANREFVGQRITDLLKEIQSERGHNWEKGTSSHLLPSYTRNQEWSGMIGDLELLRSLRITLDLS